MKKWNICIFWDSITWWAFDLEKWWWADILKINFFKEPFVKNTFEWFKEVYNLWISWKTSTDLLYRFEIEAKSRNCSFAIIAIWINDSCFLWNENNNLVSKEIFLKNLEEIYKISKNIWIEKIIFVWLTYVDEKLVNPLPQSSTWKSYKNWIIREYDDIIKNFCENNKIDFVDLDWFIKDEDLSDWLHPNSEWHKKIAWKVFLEIKKYL